MPVTVVGVRHHSPACAQLVADTIRAQQPAYVLIEGPADMNHRIDELLLGHELPVAIFSSYRDPERHHASWSPFCAHSPEWVALIEARLHGAQIRFIDLPAWHEALAGRTNRYADAEVRYADVSDRLCVAFGVDNVDALWDHLFEANAGPDLAFQLEAYFDLLRGEADPGPDDLAREAYMVQWVHAAAHAAGPEPVVVVVGGFHRPALMRAAAAPPPATDWPAVPAMPEHAVGGSYLVPYSYRRLDAFDGYQSGMPSPMYYQQVWARGIADAGEWIVETVAARLRARRQPVSTADLIAARTVTLGLARVRGHDAPARLDVLDGLVSALITEALDQPAPWARRGRLSAGTNPVLVEMVAAISGDAVGRLHPDTPHPPLLHDVEAEFERVGLPDEGLVRLDLTDPQNLAASRVLHRLRVLEVWGVRRLHGPAVGGEPVLDEAWELGSPSARLPSLLEAGSFGPTLLDAAAAALHDRHEQDGATIEEVLFDAALCGLGALADEVLAALSEQVHLIPELASLGPLLHTALGLWRHDRLLGAAASTAVGLLVDAAVTRALWLIEGIHGGAPAPADEKRLQAVVGVRDALLHAENVLGVDRDDVIALARRCAGADRPPDLRGAMVGLACALDPDPADGDDVRTAVHAAAHPDLLGDFLAGLFALAREQVVAAADGGILGELDEIVAGFTEHDFLRGLPALRGSFAWFPPREREAIAHALLDRRGLRGSAASLLRLRVEPELFARAHAVETRVAELLARESLLAGPVRGD